MDALGCARLGEGGVRRFKHYTQAEKDWIIQNYAKYTAKQMAQMCGRSASGVTYLCQRLGLSPKKPKWTEQERRKVLTEYGPKTVIQLAREMNRSEYALYQFVMRHRWG